MTLKDKCIEHDRIEFIANILKFNREIMELNCKYEEEINKLKLIIATAIKIYEKCEETQDYSTCDLDMYEVLKGSGKE